MALVETIRVGGDIQGAQATPRVVKGGGLDDVALHLPRRHVPAIVRKGEAYEEFHRDASRVASRRVLLGGVTPVLVRRLAKQ